MVKINFVNNSSAHSQVQQGNTYPIRMLLLFWGVNRLIPSSYSLPDNYFEFTNVRANKIEVYLVDKPQDLPIEVGMIEGEEKVTQSVSYALYEGGTLAIKLHVSPEYLALSEKSYLASVNTAYLRSIFLLKYNRDDYNEFYKKLNTVVAAAEGMNALKRTK